MIDPIEIRIDRVIALYDRLLKVAGKRSESTHFTPKVLINRLAAEALDLFCYTFNIFLETYVLSERDKKILILGILEYTKHYLFDKVEGRDI